MRSLLEIASPFSNYPPSCEERSANPSKAAVNVKSIFGRQWPDHSHWPGTITVETMTSMLMITSPSSPVLIPLHLTLKWSCHSTTTVVSKISFLQIRFQRHCNHLQNLAVRTTSGCEEENNLYKMQKGRLDDFSGQSCAMSSVLSCTLLMGGVRRNSPQIVCSFITVN